LAEKGLERQLFNQFSAKLEAAGVFAKNGSIIDATIVEVPKQRNSREENARIKAGHVPAEWDDNKSSHKDTDARRSLKPSAGTIARNRKSVQWLSMCSGSWRTQ
jgi:IS5 family transposase